MQTPCSDPIAVLLISREERPLPEASRGLEKEGFRIRRISEWRALQWPPLESPDLIILDLPDRNRDSLLPCAEIRKRFCGPLLVLADAAGEAFHILGLELGADDVVEKPVSHALLSAKLKSLLRRHHRPGGEIAVLRHGDLSLDRSRREVRLAGSLVTLTTVEFDLLWLLAGRAGTAVSRDEIHRALYASVYDGFNRAIDLYVSQLRRKLGDDPTTPRYLKTVRGVGHLFAP